MTTDIDDFLQHYGVAGMRWGHRTGGAAGPSRSERKAAKKEARNEEDRNIVAARIRMERRAGALNNKAALTYTATTKKGREAAEKAYDKAAKTAINHPDNDTAAKMTHGEKVGNRLALGISLGSIGLLVAATAASVALDR